MTRRRLDAELVRRGLAASLGEARAAVRDGLVTVGGSRAIAATSLVASDQAVVVHDSTGGRGFVSRGGDKLRSALDRFGIDPSDRDCLDAGASTGGFTDVLLEGGAARVVAVDVGYGQLAWKLRSDPRVTVVDRTNVRNLASSQLPFAPDLVVADLSFISLRLVLPALARVGTPSAEYVLLVKPQFEAERREIGSGGVVRDQAVWRRVLFDVADGCAHEGIGPIGVMASPLVGPAGNVEFLIFGRRGAEPGAVDVDAAVAEGAKR